MQDQGPALQRLRALIASAIQGAAEDNPPSHLLERRIVGDVLAQDILDGHTIPFLPPEYAEARWAPPAEQAWTAVEFLDATPGAWELVFGVPTR